MRVVLGNSNYMRTSKWRDRKKTHQLCPGSGAPQSSMICIDQTFGDRNPNHDTVVMRQEDQEPDFTNEDHYKIVIKEENQDPDSTDQVGIEEEQDTDFIVLGLEEDQEEEPLSTGPQDVTSHGSASNPPVFPVRTHRATLRLLLVTSAMRRLNDLLRPGHAWIIS